MSKDDKQELKIELTPEVASGHYSNLCFINHSGGEFFLDFIAVTPGVPQPKVQTRVIMNPENAKNLLFALSDNIRKYEATFGEIHPAEPRAPKGGNTDDTDGGFPNPFIGGGKA